MKKKLITCAIQAAIFTSLASTPTISVAEEQKKLTEVERKAVVATTNAKVKNNDNNDNNDVVERISVTGSYIKRLDLEGPTPVQIITRDDIEALGFDTMTEVLQSITASSGVVQTNLDNRSTSRSATTANLRGLGANRTLVLVNGIRVPKFPGSFGGNSNAFDLNTLPSEAVDRIEIVPGGNSAIYGSDAMGGVMNVILKRSYDGTKIKASVQDTERGGGKRTNFSILTGFEVAGTQNLLVLEYQKKEALLKNEREWTRGFGVKNDNWYSSWGAYFRDYNKVFTPGRNIPSEDECNSLFGDNARYVPGYWDGQVHPEEIEKLIAQGIDPTSTEGLAHLEKFGLRSTTYKCRYNSLSGVDALYPGYEKYNLTYRNTWQIDDNWEMTNSLSYYLRKSVQRSDAARHSTPSIYRNKDNGNLVYSDDRLDGSSYDRFQVIRAMPEYGDENQVIKNNSWYFTSALTGTIGDYDLAVTGSYGEATRHRKSGRAMLMNQILDVLTFDPNDPLRGNDKWYPLDLMTPAQVELTGGYRISDSKTSMANLTAILSGELIKNFFGNGAIDFATILDYNREVMDDDLLYPRGPLIGRGGAGGSGDRKRYAVAGEFSFPLMEDEVLRSNVAIRYDHYDDATEVGGAFTPQIDLVYRPTDSIVMRAKYAETFRAPDLQRISSEVVELFSSTSRPIPGQAPFDANETDSYNSIQSGSKQLKEETGKTWNVGMVFQATDDLSFNIDYWGVKLDGKVTSISSNYILAPQNFANFNKTGQAANCSELSGPGVIISNVSREGSDGITRDYLDLSCIRTGPINASLQESKGVDFGFLYEVSTDIGKFSLASNATYLATSLRQDLPDSLVIDDIAQSHDPEWKVNSRLSWRKDDYSATLSWYYLGSARTIDADSSPRDPQTLIRLRDDSGKLLPKQTFYGAYAASHKFNLTGTYRGFQNTKISFNILNLLDEDPTIDPLYHKHRNDFSSSLGHDLYGRQFKLTASYKF